jgi:hypothetical protein
MNLSEPGLDREEADRALDRLDGECDRIAEALVAMDGHPGHRLLRSATPSGLTQQKWAETSVAMATLWEQFGTYRTLIERAKEVRARRSRPGQEELAELTELLTGQVVELNREQLPIEQRTLTGPALTVERITLTQLVERMKTAYASITAVLADADASWTATIARLDPLEMQLRTVLSVAERAGPDQLEALNRIREQLAAARELAVTDPLAAKAQDPLGTIEKDLGTLRAELAALATAKETFDDRLSRIESVLATIESTQEQARTADATVREKIASPGLPALADHSQSLRARLDRLATIRNEADWSRVAAQLDAADQAAADALSDATGQLTARTGLLDRRSELRGRLDAYRAKAARRGRAEDLELSDLHTRAYDLLYTSPCDLAAATRAVNLYQQAVTRQEGSR